MLHFKTLPLLLAFPNMQPPGQDGIRSVTETLVLPILDLELLPTSGRHQLSCGSSTPDLPEKHLGCLPISKHHQMRIIKSN